MTVQLARVCERILATDVALSAVQQARRRCAAFKNIAIRRADLAAEQPRGPFDLIVLSEIGAGFRPTDLIRIGRSLADALSTGGELMAVHRLAKGRQGLHGDAVHSLLGQHLPLEWAGGLRDAGFRIDHWVRV